MKPPARLVGFNHAILEVGDIEENLSFYERLFKAALRGHGPGMAFIGAGDQFITLSESPRAGHKPRWSVPHRRGGR